MFIYFWKRERESERWRGKESGRHRIQSRLQGLNNQHRAWCGAQTHEPWDHDLSWSWTVNKLSHPGVPWLNHFWWCRLGSGMPIASIYLENVLIPLVTIQHHRVSVAFHFSYLHYRLVSFHSETKTKTETTPNTQNKTKQNRLPLSTYLFVQ